MKILAGELRGHSFSQPPTATVRPLSDKVRAAIFDVYGPVDGASVLDAFAGSGAAGFEAASRGASMVEAVEANSKVAAVIAANAKTLRFDWGYQLHQTTVATWLARRGETGARYQLIIADPPYSQLEPDVIERLVGLLAVGGILVLSHTSKLESPILARSNLVKCKVYGDTALSFYRSSV